jgi:hypothetical protein
MGVMEPRGNRIGAAWADQEMSATADRFARLAAKFK